MGIRYARCACGTEIASGERGCVPKYCEACSRERAYEANQRWNRAHPGGRKAYSDKYYADPVKRAADQARCRRNYAKNREARAVYRRRVYLERQQATNTERVLAYRRANPGVHAEIAERRRARILGQFVAPVDPSEVRERSHGMCGICGEYVRIEEQSIDHIIPFALGGTHEPANVQLAHRVCNSRKGARLTVPGT